MATYPTEFGCVETVELGNGLRVVILVHGSGGSPVGLYDIARRLADQGYRVVVPALHGYMSTRVDLDLTVLERHERVLNWCLEQHNGFVHGIASHSLGCAVTLNALRHSRLPRRLALIEPILIKLLSPEKPLHMQVKAEDEELLSELRQLLDMDQPLEAMKRFIDFWNEMSWAEMPKPIQQALVEMAPQLVEEVHAAAEVDFEDTGLGWLTAPTLLIDATESPKVATCVCESLSEMVTHTSRTTIADSGHMGPTLNPEPYAVALTEFFSGKTG